MGNGLPSESEGHEIGESPRNWILLPKDALLQLSKDALVQLYMKAPGTLWKPGQKAVKSQTSQAVGILPFTVARIRAVIL